MLNIKGINLVKKVGLPTNLDKEKPGREYGYFESVELRMWIIFLRFIIMAGNSNENVQT